MKIEDYVTPSEVAKKTNLSYPAVMARIKTGKIVATKVGWNYLIHKDEIKKLTDSK